MALGNQALRDRDFESAEKWFLAMLEHPEQLHQGRSYDENESAAYYHLGLLEEARGDLSKAGSFFKTAVEQPYPNLWHAASYRENEYYAALAAIKIGRMDIHEKVKERLLDCTSKSPASGVDFLPLGRLYWSALAAARGYMLDGRWFDASAELDRLQQLYGQCWPLEEARRIVGLTEQRACDSVIQGVG